MIFGVPSYYKEFRCIADRCKDSCCIGWEIDIDEDTFAYYKSVEGTFGRRLSEHMTEEGQNGFALRENGWCPFLNAKKLCDICIELGEEALCEVCTEYPRFTMEYENVREKVLSLSCEEVGRILFSSAEKTTWEERELPDFCDDAQDAAWEAGDDEPEDAARDAGDDEGDADEGEVDAAWLRKVRACAVEILQDRAKPVFVRAAEYLRYCEEMQQELLNFGLASEGRLASKERKTSGEKTAACGQTEIYGKTFARDGRKETADRKRTWQQWRGETAERAYEAFLLRMERFGQLEVLDAAWEKEKEQLLHIFTKENYLAAMREFWQSHKQFEYEYEHLLVYFTYRYFMRAYYDNQILVKAQFAVASVLMIRDMDVLRYLQNERSFSLDDRIETAKLYSREVEHSEENMELLAEDFGFEEVFSVESLCQALLACGEEQAETR